MDYFKGLSTSGIFGTKAEKVETYSLTKGEYKYIEKYKIHKYYFKYGSIALKQPTLDEINNSKNTYLLLNAGTIYRKKDVDAYEYFDNESSTWVIDDEMDDEWLQITVDNEAVLKIKA